MDSLEQRGTEDDISTTLVVQLRTEEGSLLGEVEQGDIEPQP